MNDRYRSRKFFLAAFSILFSALAVSQSWIGGGEWVAVTGLVTGLYGAANVGEKYAVSK